jgi:hypothetical protein
LGLAIVNEQDEKPLLPMNVAVNLLYSAGSAELPSFD